MTSSTAFRRWGAFFVATGVFLVALGTWLYVEWRDPILFITGSMGFVSIANGIWLWRNNAD